MVNFSSPHSRAKFHNPSFKTEPKNISRTLKSRNSTLKVGLDKMQKCERQTLRLFLQSFGTTTAGISLNLTKFISAISPPAFSCCDTFCSFSRRQARTTWVFCQTNDASDAAGWDTGFQWRQCRLAETNSECLEMLFWWRRREHCSGCFSQVCKTGISKTGISKTGISKEWKSKKGKP